MAQQFNIGYICTRQQCNQGKSDQVTMRWIEPDSLHYKDYSFLQLEEESNRFANGLILLFYSYLGSSEKYKIILEVQDYFVSFGQENGISVRGSYNPDDISCVEEDFIDHMYSRPSCKIF